ncbi:MAG: cell surface protein SprA [Bacteroidota bacterium]
MTFGRLNYSFRAFVVAGISCVGIAFTVSPRSLRVDSSFEWSTVYSAKDTTDADTIPQPYEPSRKPTFKQKDRLGDPFSNNLSKSPLLLKDPASLELDVTIDTALNYTIYEKIGDLNYRPTSSMSFEQFKQYQERQMLKDYWKNRSAGLDGESAVSGRSLIPPIYISPVFDRIFGGTYVEIIPRGFVTLDFGGRWQRINNPAIPIRQQRNGGFEFDQQISMNVTGKIGEKLQVTANFDNNNSFDFENNLKVEYTGFEEDILQKLEIGNVSLPLNNSLITGAQNLFGVKAQLQFGDLFVTTVASTQRGKSETIEIEGGGGQGRDFEILASNYDENRHFFLGHFFRENYEEWVSGVPLISSGVNVTNVEVYVVNRNNDTETLRDVVGLMDLAEPNEENIFRNAVVTPNLGSVANSNNSNDLFGRLPGQNDNNRNSDQINAFLEGLVGTDGIGLQEGLDYEKITSARKLDFNEYTINSKLGYISLFRKLQNDEALAVSYQYSFNGQFFTVGELSRDYTNLDEDKVVFLKLLRPRQIRIDAPLNTDSDELKRVPTWELMMKNIYSLNATNVNPEGFQLRVIYRDDITGIDNPQLQEGIVTSTTPLIEVLGLDKLNPNNDPQRDGNFDFVEDITIDTETGVVIFPFLRPFSDALDSAFLNDPREEELKAKFSYNELYNSTLIDAQLVSSKNKFIIQGSFQSGSSNEIIIPGFNIAEGSVRVFAGGSPLVENTDFRVDYTFGKVSIINEGVLNSGKKITISYEKADLFNFQSRTLLGARFDYRVNDDVNFGATVLRLNERPLITRISVGNEPTRNTKYGFDVNIQKESRFITKMLDKLPLIQTKEPSAINFNAEFAQLIPGTSNIIDGEGTSYIDDFENSATPFSLNNPSNWRLASTPSSRFKPEFHGPMDNPRRENDFRAKLAWYQIDNLFYRNDRRTPDAITDTELQNHYVRAVTPQEIFPGLDPNIINFQQIFDLAYYPNERGQYNYTTETDGTFFSETRDTRDNWGGITNAIRSEVDFDKANVEYIEFWLMDPFLERSNPGSPNVQISGNPGTTEGGDLVFNLGSISEDVIPDNRHGFENGLPPNGVASNREAVDSTDWGFVTREPFLTNAFDNSESARANQDIGLDGLNNTAEQNFFGGIFEDFEDPSADDFTYFLGDDLDQRNAGILERYKNFNGLENNSPVVTSENSLFTPSGTTLPDNEDLNDDNTLSELEEYYEYKVDLDPNELSTNRFVVDQIEVSNEYNNGDEVTWYLFRIPIRQFDTQFGNISGFKSIRYMRMYLTDFADPVVLRMANFRLVASRWRRDPGRFEEANFDDSGDALEPPDDFTVSVVNIEENGAGTETQSPYVLPPGFDRDRDNTSALERRLNEQSLQVCVENIDDGQARAVVKQVGLDLINYGRVKMFFHADSETAEEGEVTAFLRMGTDVDSNYYEIEIPLKITPPGSQVVSEIWPDSNQIDLDLNQLYALKSERDRLGLNKSFVFPRDSAKVVGRHRIRLRGNPDLSAVEWLTIGVRNPKSPDGRPHSACVWANELRVTDFDRTKGWAANATLNAKLADLANITATLRHTTFGFGGIQSRIAERTREETTSYDISANITLDKLLPERLGLKIPMFVSYQRTTIEPRFDPANPDITVEASLQSFGTQEERDEYEDIVTDTETRRSINFINVRKVKVREDAKKHIYDFENFSFSYSFSEVVQTNFNLQRFLRENQTGSIAYNYSPTNEPWEPFKNSKLLDKKYLKLIKEFNINPIPTNISVRWDLNRQLVQRIYRNNNNGNLENFEKFFTFDRNYNVRWDLTKSISIDYASRAEAIVDEPNSSPFGGNNLEQTDPQQPPEFISREQYRDSVWSNLKRLGRMKNFNQSVNANYRLPFDKIPLTDWINGDYRYQVSYAWRAGPFYADRQQADTLGFGNTIQNSRDNSLSGKFDLVKLYNKVGFLKKINSPPRNTRRSSLRQNTQTDTTENKRNESKLAKGILKLLMSVRSLNATYSLRQGTIINGFTPTVYLFGMDSSFNEPGWGFIFGSQNPDIRNRLADKNLLSRNPNLTTPFTQTETETIDIRADVEPFKDFKIQLNAKKTVNSAFEEIFRFDEDQEEFVSLSPARSGAYNISFLTIATAFQRDDDNNNSPVFEEFERNRLEILSRFREINPLYDTNSQDVLIPAFIAAYSGKDARDVSLSPFPKTPIPNWRVDFAGLGKIPALQEKFQSISITHAYQSSYSVTNYNSNLEYEQGLELNNSLANYNTREFAEDENDLIPIYNISQVLISEQFSPLIGVSIRTKSRFTARVEYKTQRDVALNINNAQVTEVNSNDIVLEMGFTKKNMRLPFKSQGRVITLKNDLTFRMNFTIRDTETVQRRINEISTITNGALNIQFRPNIDYILNEKLNLQFYFERNINEPKISRSFRRATTRLGVQVRFSLAQ